MFENALLPSEIYKNLPTAPREAFAFLLRNILKSYDDQRRIAIESADFSYLSGLNLYFFQIIENTQKIFSVDYINFEVIDSNKSEDIRNLYSLAESLIDFLSSLNPVQKKSKTIITPGLWAFMALQFSDIKQLMGFHCTPRISRSFDIEIACNIFESKLQQKSCDASDLLYILIRFNYLIVKCHDYHNDLSGVSSRLIGMIDIINSHIFGEKEYIVKEFRKQYDQDFGEDEYPDS